MPKLFGTNGIRGPAEQLFTKDFCIKLGSVFGQWLKSKHKEGSVAVAMDPRDSSPRIKNHLCQGLASEGFEILDEGVVPTPALTYFVKQSSYVAAGVMVTGSHITANLNGVKFLVDGEEVTKAQESEIEELFNKWTGGTTSITPIPTFENKAQDLYVQMLIDQADLPYPKWKIVVDTANGAQAELMRQLFDNLGIDASFVGDNDVQSDHFVARDTETHDSVVDLMREVLSQGADLGVAFDVDGDRVVFVDDLGRFIPGDYACSLIAKNLNIQSVVTPVSSSSVVDEIGKKIHRTQVGATHVIAKMHEVKAGFGFEANGGGIFPEIMFARDGGSTLIHMLNLLKKQRLPLSQLYNQLPQYHLFRDKIDCPVKDYSRIYEQVRQKYSDKKIDTLDGLKVYLTQSEWILFRGSGNAPEFRVFTQSSGPKQASKLRLEALQLVKQALEPHARTQAGFSDTLHIFDAIQQFPQQCEQALFESSTLDIPSDYHFVDKVVLCGMGGSALGGRIASALERDQLKVPFFVSTEFHLPGFVDERALVIISSYSGNTAEGLSCFEEAVKRGSKIVGITTGGKLADRLRTAKLPSFVITPRHNPSGQPRMGVGYSTLAVMGILARCQLIKPLVNVTNLSSFLSSTQTITSKSTGDLVQTVVEKIPIIFSGEHLKGSAHAVKNMINENAKCFAVSFDLPEADHHLLEGLSFPFDDVRDLAFIFLESDRYHPELKKRFELTSQVFAKQQVPVVHIKVVGESELFEAMWTVQWGLYLSYHLARAYHTDPGPIPWVNYIKEQLKA